MKLTFNKRTALSVAQIATAISMALAPFAVTKAQLAAPGCADAMRLVNTAHAQLSPVTGGTKSNKQIKGINCEKDTSLNDLIIKVINWILAITLAIDVLFLIIGGFWYITSAGNEERATKGKNTVVNAIIGLVIIVLAYVIANVIANFFKKSGGE